MGEMVTGRPGNFVRSSAESCQGPHKLLAQHAGRTRASETLVNDNEMNPGPAGPWSPADDWAPGWYADPWRSGRERRWTGNAWTSETRGALGPNIDGLGGRSAAPPAPQLPPEEAAPVPTGTHWDRRRIVALVGALAAIALVVGFVSAYAASGTSNAASPPPTTVPTQPPSAGQSPPFSIPGNPSFTPPLGLNPGGEGSSGNGQPGSGSSGGLPGSGSNGGQSNGGSAAGPQSSDPSANVLQQLVVRSADVTQPNSVATSDGGDSVAGAPTLDLCNGTYPSESLRSARLQVDVIDGNQNPLFSTEAVLYQNAAATAQAFSELKSVVAQCPSTPVQSPVGEPTVATKFTTAPDTGPAVSGVDRQAYAFTITDGNGATNNGVAVYLRRGRALVGLYFQNPSGSQPSVAGKTTIASIVGVFAQRLASAPASAIGA
jgi:hypothetical protein